MKIDLNRLAKGMPAITSAFGQYLAEAGAVCMESQNHSQGQQLTVKGTHTGTYPVTWPTVTEQMERSLNDPEVTTEHGAVGIAVLLTKELHGYSVIERSRKGTGIDYWLGHEEDSQNYLKKARLEISGIRVGNAKVIQSRLKKKLHQTDQSAHTILPAHVIIVEFGAPQAEMHIK